MKFYVLKHPEFGYLRSKTPYSCRWTFDLQWAKKWNQRNHPANVLNQSYSDEIKSCEVVEIDYEINVI